MTVQRSKFIQIFVYGKLSSSNDELEDQLLERNPEKKEKELALSGQQDGSRLNFNYLIVLFYCFAGLQLSYLTWGVIQEKIMTIQYTKTNISSQKIGEFYVLCLVIRSMVFRVVSDSICQIL